MKKNMKQLVAVVTRGDRSYWTRIGVAFENAKDRSWTLRFDYVPTDGATTIQLRDFRREDAEDAEPRTEILAQPF